MTENGSREHDSTRVDDRVEAVRAHPPLDSRGRRTAPWFAVATLAYAAVLSSALAVAIPEAALVGDPEWGLDYRVYARAGRELWTPALYAPRPELPFLYPPIAGMLFAALRFIPEALGHAVLNIATVAATVTTAHHVLARYDFGTRAQRHALAFAAAGLFSLTTPWRTELALGQINSLLLAAIVIAATRTGDRARDGVLLGAATSIKLAAGIVVPGFLLARRWRTAAGAVLTFLVTVAVGVLVLGGTAVRYWFEVLPRMSNGPVRTEVFSQNLAAALSRLGLAPPLGWGLLAVLTVIGLSIAVRRRDHFKAVLVLGMAGLLAQPVTWTHHWVWLGPAALVLLIGVVRCAHPYRWACCLVLLLGTILFPVGYALPGHSLSGSGLDLGRALPASGYALLGLALLVLIPLCPTGRRPQDAST
ncbi:glycosyltransferase 87 family protein [Saccharopolyspora sp. NPDC002578]